MYATLFGVRVGLIMLPDTDTELFLKWHSVPLSIKFSNNGRISSEDKESWQATKLSCCWATLQKNPPQKTTMNLRICLSRTQEESSTVFMIGMLFQWHLMTRVLFTLNASLFRTHISPQNVAPPKLPICSHVLIILSRGQSSSRPNFHAHFLTML